MSENNLRDIESPCVAFAALESSLGTVGLTVPEVHFESAEPLVGDAPVIEAEGTHSTVTLNSQTGDPSGETSFLDLALSQAV